MRSRPGRCSLVTCSQPGSPSPGAWVDPLPPRPADLVLDVGDPCLLVTPAQAATAGVTSAGEGFVDGGVPGCDWSVGNGEARYSIQIFARTGARAFVPGNPQQQGRDVLEDPTLTTVDGYGAIVSGLRRGGSTDCSVIVDTGPDASIRVIRSDLNRSDRNTNCDKASELAGLALRTLAE